METTINKAAVAKAIINSASTTNKVANGSFTNLIVGAILDLTGLKSDLSNLDTFLQYVERTRQKLVNGEWKDDPTPSTRDQVCPISGEVLVPKGSKVRVDLQFGPEEATAWPFMSLLRCSETTINGVAYGATSVPVVEMLKTLAGKKWKCEAAGDGTPIGGRTPRYYTIVEA